MFANDGHIHFKMTGSSHTARFNFSFISSNPRTWPPIPPYLQKFLPHPIYDLNTRGNARYVQPNRAVQYGPRRMSSVRFTELQISLSAG